MCPRARGRALSAARCVIAHTPGAFTLCFVPLCHQYAADLKAGWDDPAVAGQLAVAACLDRNTLTLGEQHPTGRLFCPPLYGDGAAKQGRV